MSVINQMLKDLDKRQSEQQGGANITVPTPTKTSTGKWLLLVVVIIICNVVGVFSWQLYSENQQLKSQVEKGSLTHKAQHEPLKTAENKSADISLAAESKPEIHAVETMSTARNTPKLPVLNTSEQSNKVVGRPLDASSENKNLSTNQIAKNDSVSHVTAMTAPERMIKQVTSPEPDSEMVKAKPSLTISRSQLSPQALAVKKITEAEQAIERNDIIKAESLFEEVLLVMPEHETARKQLAALWYGKKSYQDAINLLSQGIALAPQAEEMRLMTARIYYEQGQTRQAYNILRPIKHSVSTELQALLANTAAELNEHENAVTAYEKLIALEPNIGRWWLGSAVSLDSLGQFIPARNAYKQAIARNNLSSSAMQFARQRLIELGE